MLRSSLRIRIAHGYRRRQMSTVEIEPKENWFDKMQRYALYGSPVIAAVTVTSLTINFPSFREYMENVFPVYVDYLRTNVGFDDENPVELAHKAALEAQLSKCVNLRVTLANGEEVTLTNVDGRKLIPELLAEQGFRDNRAVKKIEVEDSLDSEENVPCPPTSSSNEESSYSAQPRKAPALYDVAFRSSMWDYVTRYDCAPGNDELRIPDNSQEDPGNPASNASSGAASTAQAWSRDSIVLARYQDYGAFITSNLERSGIFTDATSKASTQGDGSSRAAEKAYKREYIKQSVAKLERKLQEHEAEMRSGSMRNMDDIAADIQRVKSEILYLQRNHLNTFYYF